ncbi:DNA-binding response regulator, NarL/FixJ family, contains REC and HTH domains [Micromonospora phaseoli]|uniref:DNA-binding response regulator, NarL/FixJ family, contains REC and HTH domains n=1 Tax=Micromonospora phaseoli TaxID=1144548 RepID=A0A1H6VDW3_9ACTN|nr:response regulator transcription factor [Micromonospora phaseoli]PZV93598.1 LuxR family two component transcriptional regulator [Micromonospora phaseoli]GIJ80227.1 DNA-binding response regulator [Micromonospora phaseoli]SEJ02738.1 DNA-binding response regulator, NarL/FixJ family, contains REC and HTH domains [Micromonospora phaseoli]
MTRVVIVDDQTLIRQGIRGLLEVAEIDVVGEADDGRTALAVVAQTSPDVILLDLRMPRFDGIWTLEQLRAGDIDIPVLVLTTFDDDELVLGALRAGARGYLLKDVTLNQLTRAIRALADGGTLIAPSITDRMLRAIRSGPSPLGPEAASVQSLTEREQEVLRLVARGYSNREIAEVFFLAEGTVKNHVSMILTKLGARDRTNAVLRALHEGILD